jgi:hypothetical protein
LNQMVQYSRIGFRRALGRRPTRCSGTARACRGDAAGIGAADAMGETFEQLDELLVTVGASAGR